MRYELEPGLEEFLRSLPKTETHLHLEGAVPLDLYRSRLPHLPREAPFLEPDFRYRDFDHFNETILAHALPFFTSLDRYEEGAASALAACAAQGVRYVEISFHLGVLALTPGLDPREVPGRIRRAAPEGMTVRVYAGLLHCDYDGVLREWIDEAPEWTGLDGFDLHGPEELPLEEWTAVAWKRARVAGKRNRAHAGEFLGPEFVERVVRELGVDRVAHGVRAAEDPKVMRFLKERGVTLDVCPLSNWKLRVPGVDALASHPIRRLCAEGVRVTVSSDDPTFFGNRLIDDYAALHLEAGFSPGELVRLARNGFEAAWMDEDQKAALIEECSGLLAESEGS